MSPSTYVFTISHQITSSDTWEEIVVDRILGIESQEPQEEEDELKYIIEIELLRANDTYNINKETRHPVSCFILYKQYYTRQKQGKVSILYMTESGGM